MVANSATSPRKRKRRWFQFRLRTLLIFVTLVCAACGSAVRFSAYWDGAARESKKTHEFLDDYVARIPPGLRSLSPHFDATMDYWETYLEAARNVCVADCAVPFSDRADACNQYWQTVLKAERAIKQDTLVPDRMRDSLIEVGQYKFEAEEWLNAGCASGDLRPIPERRVGVFSIDRDIAEIVRQAEAEKRDSSHDRE